MEEVVDLLSDISDFLGVLTEMLEIAAEVIWVRALTKYDPEVAQICLQIYAFKICVKQIPFAIECKFTVAEEVH
jgi:hypothetical protein